MFLDPRLSPPISIAATEIPVIQSLMQVTEKKRGRGEQGRGKAIQSDSDRIVPNVPMIPRL